MASARKTLTVSYGTFSCTLEGFDDAFATMKEVAHYFRELSAEDRYFGAVPPTPDAETLKRIAEREVRRRVEATLQDKKVFLRAAGDAESWVEQEPPHSPPPMPGESVAARLARLRSTISRRRAQEGEVPPRSIFADDEEGGGVPEPSHPPSGPAPGVPEAAVAREAQREPGGGAAAASLMEPPAGAAGPDATGADASGGPDADQAPAAAAAAARDDGPRRPEAEKAAADGGAPEAEFLPGGATGGRETDRAGTAADEGSGEAGDAMPPGASAQSEPAASGAAAPGDAGSVAEGAEPPGDVAPEGPAEAVAADRDAMRALQAEALAQAFSDEDGEEADAPAGPSGPDASPPEFPDERDSAADSEPADESRSLGTDAPEVPAEVISKERALPDPADGKAEPSDATDAAGRAAEGAFPGSGAQGPASSTETRAEQQLRDFFSRLRNAGAGAARGGEGRFAPGPGPAPEPVRPPAAATDARDVPAGERPRTEPPSEPVPDAAMPADPVKATTGPDRPEPQDGAAPDAPEPETGAAPDRESRPRQRDGRTILETTNGASTDDDSVTRLVETAKTRLEVAESQRRLAAFSHLKAAVAATKADRMMGTSQEEEDARKDEAEIGRYRDDLSRAVQGDAPEEGPLRLEDPQRRREPGAAGDAAETGRSVGGGRLSAGDDEDADEGDDGPSRGGSIPSRPFPEFAREAGVSDLPDLLEAAAAYLTEEEGRPLFSRPQIMRKVALMASEEDFSREDGLRAFGALLRQGRIQKVRRGQFSISLSSRFVKQGRGLPN